MQKSLYQDKSFADYWNERAGDNGEAYKRYVLDPLMFKLIGDQTGTAILELGCGNGYLAPMFLALSPKRVVMMDISEHNLSHAANRTSDQRVEFLRQDATTNWSVKDASIDLVYSNMMLNEVADIKTPINEAYRVLSKSGTFVFSVTHPAWDLYIYAQAKAGITSKKMKGLGGYFRRGPARFIMGGDSKSKPELKQKYRQEFAVEHYQRPISDYFNQLVDAGFSVKRLLEPEMTPELLKNHPRFSEYTDNPIGLVFFCEKPEQKK
jgi:ubiquinone/menaquinone biosynthesis C-methylase UbiE